MEKLYKLLAILIIPVIYYLLFVGYKEETFRVSSSGVMMPPEPIPKDFLNFILNTNYGDTVPAYWDIDQNGHLDSMKELNFNAVHFYEDTGTYRLGYFIQQNLTQTQKDNVNTLENLIHSNNMKSVFERVRISQLCYAQRLIYEVSSGGDSRVNYGFAYLDIMPNTYATDSGRTVLHASPIPNGGNNSPGWLCDSIYENMQHTDLYMFRPQRADTSNWFVKPMMRIKQSDFNDPLNRDLPVVKINIVNFEGDTINSVILRVWNFRDGNGNYSGNYLEKYTFELGLDSLKVSGRLEDGLNYRGTSQECNVDFKVYWFGQVEVWFDKMTVDDIYANGLFDRNYDAFITDAATPENFILIASFVNDGTLRQSNALAFNHVMNKMYNKLKNRAIPISLK